MISPLRLLLFLSMALSAGAASAGSYVQVGGAVVDPILFTAAQGGGSHPFPGALMPGVDASAADLSGASLASANLALATLDGTDFMNADLSGADLNGASLVSAILT